jgi:hypothetical protein
LVAAERAKLSTPRVIESLRASVGDLPIVLCALTVAELASKAGMARFCFIQEGASHPTHTVG